MNEVFICCISYLVSCFFFFFQAEDGIRYRNVTGVQTCALPILHQPVVRGGASSIMQKTLGIGLCVALAACGANHRPQVQTAPAPSALAAATPTQTAPAPKVLVDPVAALISVSQKHFETGEREVK